MKEIFYGGVVARRITPGIQNIDLMTRTMATCAPINTTTEAATMYRYIAGPDDPVTIVSLITAMP